MLIRHLSHGEDFRLNRCPGSVDHYTPTKLLANPRIGERLEEFDPRDVRRILVGHYEMRYEIAGSTIYLLRLWHTREDR
ncbi:type II toxin-antitoxin system RelE/ParE family toxin [Pseudomonas aeruginosa]|uniref:type II toxin-antitoxin system RelE/ParE family toxin n=1 Tax=Pseudomonas aeruginosa TaxID=287 RepID=UPI0032E4EF91